MDSAKEQALATLCVLIETCKSASQSISSLPTSSSNTVTAPDSVITLITDASSIHRLIHVSTTRLSVALGKPPPSYDLALVQLKDLTTQVAQLVSCVSSLPPGMLRKEAVWTAGETIRALEALAKDFETTCRKGEQSKEYLVKMGAVHDAVERAQNMSTDENVALTKVLKRNMDGLNDSLAEVKEIMEDNSLFNNDDEGKGFSDGWDELGEEFQKNLSADEKKRVNKIYPFLRFLTLLHEKLFSSYFQKAPVKNQNVIPRRFSSLCAFSNGLLIAMDDLVVTLYSPQDVESIQEAIDLIYTLLQDLDKEFGFTEEEASEELRALHSELDNHGTQKLTWFRNCFSQINKVYNNISLTT